MVKLIKAIFLFILLLFLSFLISTTFVGDGSSNNIENISDRVSLHQNGYYNLTKSGALEYLETQGIGEADYYAEKISRFDTLYVSEASEVSDSYKIIQDRGENRIELSKGIYMLDIYDPHQKYVLVGSGFEVEPISYGAIYLDTRDITKIIILSINSSVSVSFINQVDGSNLTQLYLFPNRYLSFNSVRNIELKNADFLRISQVVNSYGYINGSLYVGGVIHDKLTRLVGDSAVDFLGLVLSSKTYQYDQNNIRYMGLRNLSLWNFPGMEYIQEKLLIFKNDTKKSVFYKNILLGELDLLFKTDNSGNQNIVSIQHYLASLRDIDELAYQEILMVMEYYSHLVLSRGDYNMQQQKKNFIDLLSKVHNTRSTFRYTSFRTLSDIYIKYNLDDDSSYLQDLPVFTNLFFEDIGAQIEEKRITNIEDDNVVLREYISSYLQSLVTQQLIGTTQGSIDIDNDILKGLLSIVNDNVLLSTYVYFTDTQSSSNSIKQTGLYQNLNFLIILEKFMRKNLFESDRTSRGILVLSQLRGLKDILADLDANTDNIKQLYTQYKDLAGDNAGKLLGYDGIGTKLDEYFLAFANYELYKRKYEQEVSDVRDTNIFVGNLDTDLFGEEAFITYISQFNGVNTSRTQVEVRDNDYYRVTQLYIDSFRIDFELYPFEGNRIEEIYIDGKKAFGSYILDQRELDLNEKIKTVAPTQRNQYDFKRFFLNTFFAQKQDTSVILQGQDEPKFEESKSVISFKKEKLLGTQKEFDFVSKYLPLEWENVVVSEALDISIADALYVSQETKTQYHAQLNAQYIFSDTKHDFKNVRVKLYDRYIQTRGEVFGLDDREIIFIGDIYIGDFNKVSQDFFTSLNEISLVYKILSNNSAISIGTILYYPGTNNTIFNFELKNVNYELNLSPGTITYIKKNTKTVADNVKPSTLADVLKVLP